MVIDAHLHLWNTERLRDQRLQRPGNAAINRTFGFEDFRSRAAAAGTDRAVPVQADDSAADTEEMFEAAAAHPEIAGSGGRVRGRPARVRQGLRLYPPDPSWTAADLREVVEFAVELFGPDLADVRQ